MIKQISIKTKFGWISAYETNGKIFVFLGESKHKIKKKAEQMACKLAIETLK